MTGRNFILVDMDHTLTAAFARDHMLDDPQVDWDAYHAAAVADRPLTDVVRVIDSLISAEMFVVGLTARPERWRQLSQKWLTDNGPKIGFLLMRPDNDYRPSPKVKTELAINYFGSEEKLRAECAAVFEDREDVCAAFRALGVTVFQVYGRRD
jgi:hypothetical protein